MKRPGPTGMSLLLAFGLVAVIETHTLLAMVGIDVPARVYYPAAAAVVAVALVALYFVPDSEGNLSKA